VKARLAMLAFVCGACHDGRVDLERMIDQRKLEAFEATSDFDDGQVMRTPPPDTVSRDSSVSRERASLALSSGNDFDALPVPLTLELLKRGQNRFDIYCSTCHGTLGDGQSQVAENMRLRPPPSLHEARLLALSSRQLYTVIRDGYGLMPAYDSALSVDDRWAVVAYVGALQLSQRSELSSLPPDLQNEAAPWLK
jgi:mono/diheme cytochrome c family protein